MSRKPWEVQVAENRELDVQRALKGTFHQLCDTYWETRGKHLKMKGLKNMIDAWKSGIGNVPLKDLSPQKSSGI